MTTIAERQDQYYRGIRMVPFDLVKELAVAMAGLLVLILILAAALSSPDEPSLTVQRWAQDDPVDFVTTASAELGGTSDTAQYGPPYNDAGSGQSIGPFAPQQWAGVHIAVDPPNDYVLQPLKFASVGNPQLTEALATYSSASGTQQGDWLKAYTDALGNAKEESGNVVVAAGDYGPLPVMMSNLLEVARSGGLDGHLLNSGRFYQTDFTRPLLFMGDGGRLAQLAQDQHLTGDQWGMMNETGQYPGQTWLWLYTIWYQLPAFQSGWLGDNADIVVVALMLVLTLLLALVPFIPGLRDIPRWLPLYRLIWRDYYRDARSRGPAGHPAKTRA